jgi:hypothetical protein
MSLSSPADGSILLLFRIFARLHLVLVQGIFSLFQSHFCINTFPRSSINDRILPSHVTRDPILSDMAKQMDMIDDELILSIPLGYNADLAGQVEALKRAKDLFKTSIDELLNGDTLVIRGYKVFEPVRTYLLTWSNFMSVGPILFQEFDGVFQEFDCESQSETIEGVITAVRKQGALKVLPQILF